MIRRFLLLSVLALMFAACGGPSGKPSADAKSFVDNMVKYAEDKDFDAADKLFETYFEFYADADPDDAMSFIEDVDDEFESLSDKDQEKLKRFMSKSKFEKLPAVKKSNRIVKRIRRRAD